MYTIKQAALRSGVGISLLRAWERRYGVVHPVRTASGYRLYDDEAIARLRAMRRLVEAGWSASQAATAVLDESSDRLVAGAAAGAPGAAPDLGPSTGPVAPTEGPVRVFVDAAGRYDGSGVEQALDEMFGRGSFETVVDGQVMPAMRALGDAWAAGTLDVAAEHLASAAVVRRLAALFDLSGTPGVGPRILVGLPPGCRHEIGPLAFAVAIRRRGVDVLYLGPDVPVDSWLDAARESRAAAAVIGVTRPADVERARDVAKALGSVGRDLLVAFGGAAAGKAAVDLGIVTLPDGVVDAAMTLAARLAGKV